jgi:hypothetical protein
MRLSVSDTGHVEESEDIDDGVSESGSLEIFFAKDAASKPLATAPSIQAAKPATTPSRQSFKQVSFPPRHDNEDAVGSGAAAAVRSGSGGKKRDDADEVLTLIIELWRADLVTSVVELDEEGNIAGGGAGGGEDKEALSELYPAGG